MLRKALHLIALVVPISMLWLGQPLAWIVWGGLGIVAVGLDVLRVRSAAFSRLIDAAFGRMMRQEERPEVGDPVVINGATWVLVASALLAFVFPLQLAVFVFVMFMLSDAAAALVGRAVGRTHWFGTSRTVEGTAAFVAVGLLVSLAYPGAPIWACAATVLVAAAVEAAPVKLNDNVRVPFVAALVLFAIHRFALGDALTLFPWA